MRIVDVGTGPAIALIPGIQGRWEWMRPTVDELAKSWRVITGSLPGEPGSRVVGRADDFDVFVEHVDRMLDSAHVSSAVLCGVSFGGLVALRYAARRKDRVAALILASAPGPRWKPNATQARYIRRPMLTLPLFLAGATRRVATELQVTFPDVRQRLAFCAAFGGRVVAAPGMPWRMGSRARLAAGENFASDCAEVKVPTLVIAGERGLDEVVNVDDAMEYVAAIRGARFRELTRTGHLGTVTRPDQFADLVSTFLREPHDR